MRKSVLCLGMALLVLWTSLVQVQPVHAAEEGGFSYTVAGMGAALTGYTGGQLGVNIPATLGGLPVTVIGREAFDTNTTGKARITSVAIPDSVATIQTYAFRDNSLSSVNLPESLTTIGASAFEGNSLTSVVFPDSMISISSYAFYRNNITSIKLNESLQTISGGAFDTNQTAKLVIPAGVRSVADYAFFRNNLTSVTVLGAATTFGATAFHENPVNMKIFGIANSPAATLAASRGYAFVDGTALFQGIETAKSLLKDHLPGTGVGHVSASAYTDLTDAYAAARLFIDGIGNATVAADLTSAAAPLSTAISTFNAAIVQAGNATTLGAKITEANQALADHSAGTNVGQTTAEARTVLQNAIATAQQIYGQAANYTQAPLNAAVADLNAAIVAFEATLIQAGSATALGAKIVEANQAMTDHPAGTGVGQTLNGDYNALQAAVATAQIVFNQAANYTQSQLDGAVAVLDAAIGTFESKIIPAGNAAALDAKLADARQALTDHPEGTNVGEASGTDRAALQSAINAAQTIFDDAANRTQTQLDSAVADMNGAITAFEAMIIPAGNPAALQSKLGDARQALIDHPEGTNVGEASGTDRTALQSAINAAQAIFDDAANRTQTQLDSAVAVLDATIMAFETALIPAGDAAALGQKIGEANQALADHPAGTGVGQTLIGDYNALQAAIATAQQLFNQAANYTDTQLAEAIADLNTVLASFEAAIIPAGNPAALAALLSDARQALADHPEGEGVGETSGLARSALQSAIDDAQTIVDAAANQTDDQLSAAAVALTEALARFEAAWVGLVLTAPANGLYGGGDTLRFTVFYGYEVTVTGTPVLPLRVGANSVTQTVYAPYTGVLGTPITELSFEYRVPAGLADLDGLEVANALELPADAGIDRVSGGAASLTYVAPATGGIRIVAIPPEITLTTSPNGSTRQVVNVSANVYGEASGNALTALRWLPGNVNVAEFAGGTRGTDLMTASQFTVTANGEYTVYAQDGAGNETAKTIVIAGISSGNSGPSAPIVPDRPANSRTTATVQPAGGIIVRVDSSDIERTSRPDGTAIERIQLSERIREQVLEALKNTKNTTIEIIVDDREAAVQMQFPAAWIGEIAKVYPNAAVETKLNGSSYRLPVSLLDLAALAKRLGTDVSAMTVSIVQEQAGQDIRREIERIGASQGFAVQSDVIDFKVTLEANGQTLEVREFGGMYVARSIQLAGGTAKRNLVAVYYDRVNSQVSFVPTRLLAGPNGTTEAVLNVPHNSLFAIVDVKARQFADLHGHWAKTDVELLASKLLVNGVTADRYAPANMLTRAEFSAMLVRGLGLTAKEGEDGVRFADVSASAWYAPMIKVAVEQGLVSGVSSDRFAPNDPITREQMAVMIGGALTLAGYTGQATEPTSAYADREAIASWAQVSVARASEAGILQGTADGRFAPKAYATRAEAAVMLKRFLYANHFIEVIPFDR